MVAARAERSVQARAHRSVTVTRKPWRILVTGKNGQVGYELRRALAPLGELIAIDSAECNFCDEAAVRRVVHDVAPDIIANPAAYTAVDKAESEPELADAINGRAPAILAAEALKHGSLLVHYSTDYVFDGNKAGFYTEDDTPNPQTVYGRSKLAGECAVERSGARRVILRTSWVVGAHGANFAKTILRMAGERESLNVVADQWGAPTSAALIADVTAQLLGRYLREGAERFPFGCYHLAAGGETNWHEYARTIVRAAQAAGRPVKLKAEAICAIGTADYPSPARRPANSRLDTRKLRQTFGLTLPDWRQGLDQILQRILSPS
jgi:dTDP-4-dehydrorhamnose reductase